MGGSKKTTVTNTGLGDNQYQKLADNQVGLKDQINNESVAAGLRYDKFDRDFATLNTGINTTGADAKAAKDNAKATKDAIGIGGADPTGLYKQFLDQNKNLTTDFGKVMTGQQGLGTSLTNQTKTLSDGQANLKDFNDDRFDTLDTSVDDNFDAISDVQDTADTIDNNTEGLGTSLDTLSKDTSDGFTNVGDTLDTEFENAQDSRDTLNKSAADSRKSLSDNLDSLSDNQDDYYEDLADTTGDIEKDQEGFISSFDTYVDRYDDDVKSANKQRSDTATGQEKANENIREDIGKYAQALSGYSTDTDTEIKELGDTVEGGFKAVDDDVSAGFKAVDDSLDSGFAASEDFIEDEIDDLDFATTIKDLKEGLEGDLDTLDTEVAAEFKNVFDAFDDQGTLIENEIDANGTTITRKLTDQGTLITDKFDAQGKKIDTTETNLNKTVGDMQKALEGDLGGVSKDVLDAYKALETNLAAQGTDINSVLKTGFDANTKTLDTNAKSLLDLGTTIGTLDTDITASFKTVSSAFDDQGKLINRTTDDLGNTVTNAIDEQGNLITKKFDASGVLIGETQTNIQKTLTDASDAQMLLQNSIADTLGGAIDSTASALSAGFDAQNGVMSEQGKQLLDVGVSLDGMSEQQKSDFAAVSDAFDAQGNLITSGTDELGNTIQREMDANGVMIERKFDAQGNLLDETSLDVTDIMAGLSQLDTIQGQVETGFTGVQNTLANQSGMMSELSDEQVSQFDKTQQAITTGFDETAGTMDTQISDLAGVASQMTDLDMDMRQQFYQLDGAFDDTGELITESVEDNGNVIQRSIDNNGNILLRAFDQTGESIGQNVININKALGDLASLETVPGASISMGNLSPAIQADPKDNEPNVPTSGFMTPFTQTV
jgi:hypothetical protein